MHSPISLIENNSCSFYCDMPEANYNKQFHELSQSIPIIGPDSYQ
jgi:hypothetical protein